MFQETGNIFSSASAPVVSMVKEAFPDELTSEHKAKDAKEKGEGDENASQSEIDLNKDIGADHADEGSGDKNSMVSFVDNSISEFLSSSTPSTVDSFKIGMYMNIKSFYSLTNDYFGGYPDPNHNISGSGICDSSFPCINVGNYSILIG